MRGYLDATQSVCSSKEDKTTKYKKIDSLFCNLQSDSQFWPALRVDAKFSDGKSVQTTCIYYCISKERPNNALQFRGLIMALSSGF